MITSTSRSNSRRQAANFSCVSRARDDTAALIYTSGSTGQPKGGAIAVNFLATIWPYVIYGLDLRRDDIFWPTGDPGWGYGFVCYLSALAAGATVISVQQNPTAELCLSILQTLSRHQSGDDADAAAQSAGAG